MVHRLFYAFASRTSFIRSIGLNILAAVTVVDEKKARRRGAPFDFRTGKDGEDVEERDAS